MAHVLTPDMLARIRATLTPAQLEACRRYKAVYMPQADYQCSRQEAARLVFARWCREQGRYASDGAPAPPAAEEG